MSCRHSFRSCRIGFGGYGPVWVWRCTKCHELAGANYLAGCLYSFAP